MTDSTRLPTGLLFAVALVAALEYGTSRPLNDCATFITASWVEAHRSAAANAPGADVLFLGDSQVKGGLIPSAFEARSGLHAYNLATIGGQPAAALSLLRRALDSGARPHAVVLGFYPGLLAADSRINLRHWPEILGPAGCVDLILAGRDFAFAGPLLTRSLLPTLRRRDEIQAAAQALATSGPDATRLKANAYRRNWALNAGAQALAQNPGFRDDPISPAGEPGSAANHLGSQWRVKPEHLTHLRKLISLAQSQGIAVFWLLPTNSPALQTLRWHSGLDAAYLRAVTNLQREFPGLKVLDPTPLLADPKVFSDPCHLDRQGAVSLSLAAADTLKTILSSKPSDTQSSLNWLILEGRENGTGVAVTLPEDVRSSILAVQSRNQGKVWR